MPETPLPEIPPPVVAAPHTNHQLFSDHYLDFTLPRRADWVALQEAAGPARDQIAALLAAWTPSGNEAQTEDGFIKPVLKALGHDFEVQPALKMAEGTKKPDYVFYRDLAALNANKGKTLTDALPQQGGFAVGDAKYWDRPLDIALKGKAKDADVFSNKNSGYQIAFYIRESGVEWGILTNGRLWRLYHRDTAHKLDRFYEVDLPALLRAPDPSAFLYFYAFFHRSAFDAHPLGVSALLRESLDYARGVGDTLKGQVYDALRHLAQGFLDYAPNGLTNDDATRREIYDSALILLYRLLFVLYAEARELLPVRESQPYRDSYSLYALKQTVAADLEAHRALLPTTATLWPRFHALFGIIDKGSPPLQAATFNGGLFDPSRHVFLDTHAVGDAHLQRALDKLARVAGQFVDYRDLSVRHLGTIYEGLLEYHLEGNGPPAPNSGGVRGEGARGEGTRSDGQGADGQGADGQDAHGVGAGSPRPLLPSRPFPLAPPLLTPPELGAGGPSSPPWTVLLLNDKGERKSSGSYYTPDFIVKYIVEQAVGPMLRQAVADQPDDAARVRAVLAVNVLDPSMGSGHFLVETTEFIARFLIDQALPVESDAHRPADGGAQEPDLLYWKRRVAQSCVYGVDLNPLAVELAKLSLWLTTVAKDRPLSFLDHHLRAGNALVGARLADLQFGGAKPKGKARAAAPAQLTMMADDTFRQSLSVAVDFMWLIEGSAAQTVADVKQQEQLYAKLRAGLSTKYNRLANLVTASHFGVAFDPHLWKPLAAYALDEESASHPKFFEWVAEAEAQAAALRFFHWELEFPEVYFDKHGKSLGDAAGFDAVVGNPPYVRQEELTPFKPFFGAVYPEIAHGVADLFVYFFGQGLRQLQQGGRLSYISSNSWLRANYATPLRRHLRAETTFETLVDLGDNHVFADAADVYPAIPVVRKAAPPAEYAVCAAVFTRGEGLKEFEAQVSEKLFPVSMHDQSDAGWQLGNDAGRLVFAKLMAGGRPLGKVVNGQMYRGVVTGFNEAFMIDTLTRNRLVAEDSASAEVIKPVLRGEDLRPWYQEDERRWLIFTRRGIDIDAHPAIKSHLQRFRTQLEPCPKDWADEDKWPGRKHGPYKWYEIQDSADYHVAFDGSKIMWPDIAKVPRFSWDASGAYVNDTCSILVAPDHYILGILQSRSIWHCVSGLCIGLGEREGLSRFRLKSQFLNHLPIPDAPDADREAIGALAQEITTEARARYALHERVRHRLRADLGPPGAALNQKLTAWWTLDFPGLQAELVKVFKKPIPVKERDEWEAWFSEQRAAHSRHTDAIIARETALNARVYTLFGLGEAEIRIIEATTKYKYGEV